MAYNCDVCDGAEVAVLLMTNLQLGDTQAVGVACLPLWAVGFAEQFVGPIKPDEDAPIDLVPTESAPQPSGRRKGKAVKTTPETPDGDTETTEPPTGE